MIADKPLLFLSLILPLSLYSNVGRVHDKRAKEAPLEKPISSSKLNEFAKIFELKSIEKNQEDVQKNEASKKHKNISAKEFRKILQIESSQEAGVVPKKGFNVVNKKLPTESGELKINNWLKDSSKSFADRVSNSRKTSVSGTKEKVQEIKVDPNSIANNKDLFDKVDFGTPQKTITSSDFIEPASLSQGRQIEDHAFIPPVIVSLNSGSSEQTSSGKVASANQETQATRQETTESNFERDVAKEKSLAKEWLNKDEDKAWENL
jgi:hypothetical protein